MCVCLCVLAIIVRSTCVRFEHVCVCARAATSLNEKLDSKQSTRSFSFCPLAQIHSTQMCRTNRLLCVTVSRLALFMSVVGYRHILYRWTKKTFITYDYSTAHSGARVIRPSYDRPAFVMTHRSQPDEFRLGSSCRRHRSSCARLRYLIGHVIGGHACRIACERSSR